VRYERFHVDLLMMMSFVRNCVGQQAHSPILLPDDVAKIVGISCTPDLLTYIASGCIN
jgi:hypothetical protein